MIAIFLLGLVAVSTVSTVPLAAEPECAGGNCTAKAGLAINRNGTAPQLLGASKKTFLLQNFFQANWYRAALFCRFQGMQLASIASQEENNEVEALIRENGLGNEHFWISGTDLAQEGSFSWLSNGRPFVYTNWHTGEPNNANHDGELENCVELTSRDGTGIKWNDERCSLQSYFVCEL